MNAVALRNVRLYGELGARFGRSHRLAVHSAAEAIRALCITVKGFERYLMESRGNGMNFAVFIGKRNIGKDELRFEANDDIRIAPILVGAKRGGILQIVLGVILVVVGYYFEQPYLVNAGYSMIIGGVVQMLSPMPKDPKSKDKGDDQASYAFNGPVNTQAQGNPVPVAYGGPMWIGSAVVSAGITVEGIYIPNIPPLALLAQGLLSKYESYWPLDTDGVSVASPHFYNWECTYGGDGAIAFDTSLLNGEGIMRVYSYANHATDLTGQSWALHFWANLDMDPNTTMYVGLGEIYLFATVPRVVIKFSTDVAGEHSFQSYAYDYGLGAFVASPLVIAPPGRAFFTLEYDGDAQIVYASIGSMMIAPLTVSAIGGLDRLLVQDVPDQFSGGLPAYTPYAQLALDEIGFIPGYRLTDNERAYLALGKTWNDITTDAAYTPPPGTDIDSGGDIWHRLHDSLGGG